MFINPGIYVSHIISHSNRGPLCLHIMIRYTVTYDARLYTIYSQWTTDLFVLIRYTVSIIYVHNTYL